MGPVGDIGTGFRTLSAGGRAVAEIDAGGAAVVLGGGNCTVGGPPMPAEVVHRLPDLGAGLAERKRRHRRFMGGIGGVAGETGHAGHAVVLGKERLKRGIVDGPVVSDAIQCADAEVGGVQARVVRGVHHGGAADGVEIDDLDGGVVVVDRVVAGALADVWAGGVIAEDAGFVVAAVGGVVGLLHPVALL